MTRKEFVDGPIRVNASTYPREVATKENESGNDVQKDLHRGVPLALQIVWNPREVGNHPLPSHGEISVLKDERGEYRYEVFFVNGKQKRRKVCLIDGIPVSEFMVRNADDIFLLREGMYEILYEREMQRSANLSPISGKPDCW